MVSENDIESATNKLYGYRILRHEMVSENDIESATNKLYGYRIHRNKQSFVENYSRKQGVSKIYGKNMYLKHKKNDARYKRASRKTMFKWR